jgi:catechol 2,3-dioxygenase-like lactoylglutathione lyase family enzyme
MRGWSIVVAGTLLVSPLPTGTRGRASAPIAATAVDSVGMTVSNMDRAIEFYTAVLTFEKTDDRELSGREYELLTGVFGARARIVQLRLGGDSIELTEFITPRGRPIPPDMRANDLTFQHAALIVSDMDRAYARLRQHGVVHASTAPQRLPDWNVNAAGIRAFYFRDPDGHFLEILQFPPGKGQPRWQQQERLFLGIDHTAIVSGDTDRSLALYRGLLGLRVAGTSENYDVEQERLNSVFAARLRITTLRAPTGPGIELLEYLAPRDGRPAPLDLKANDLAHWQTTLIAPEAEALYDRASPRPPFGLVSPRLTTADPSIGAAALIRDPDGHALRLVVKPAGH